VAAGIFTQEKLMIKSNRFFRFGGFAYAMGAIYLGAAVVFQFGAIHGASNLAIGALPWFALGVLAGWVGQALQQLAGGRETSTPPV
jgi:hypothetical protein